MSILPLLASVHFALLNVSADAPVTQVVTGHTGPHTFVVRVTAGPFRRNRHRLRTSHIIVDGTATEMSWIDGKSEYAAAGHGSSKVWYGWYGTDGGFPYTEYYSWTVKVDGKSWKFPKKLWQNCYEPGLSSEPKGGRRPTVRLFKDGKRLTIECVGGDGAGSYRVRWYLRQDGQARREVHWSGRCGCVELTRALSH